MGFWGWGIFENDAACDLIGELVNHGQRRLVEATLRRVLKSRQGDLEDWLAAEGLAAAAIVAAGRGFPVKGISKELTEWISTSRFAPSETLTKLAIQGVCRVRDDSELAELVAEGGEARLWKSHLSRLIARLSKRAKPLLPKKPPPQDSGTKNQRAIMARLKKRNVYFICKRGVPSWCSGGLQTVKTGLRDYDMADFEALTTLTELSLDRYRFSDAAALHLRALVNLVRLELKDMPLTDAAAGIFSGMTRLQHLSLARTRFGDGAAEQIGRLRRLRKLDLSGSLVTDVGVRQLAGCNALKILNLRDTQITDGALTSLARVSSLTSLVLAGTAVTSRAAQRLQSLLAIKSLSLTNTKVDDATCTALARLANLEQLSLGGTQVTARGVAKLAVLKRLKFVGLRGLSLTDDDIPILLTLPAGASLGLDGTRLSDEGRARLLASKRFSRLDGIWLFIM